MAPLLEPKADPSNPSQDHAAMRDSWQLIADILAGAKTVRAARERYLPKYLNETDFAYSRRIKCAPWRPEFESALNEMASKPFSKVVKVNEDAPDAILGEPIADKSKDRRGGLVDDIDGQGNSLHVFARETFKFGLAYGVEGIYVAYTDAEPARTVAEAKIIGARPYWVHVRGADILDLQFKVIEGKTTPIVLRTKETTTEKDGFADVVVDRVRLVELLDSPSGYFVAWKLYRRKVDASLPGAVSSEWLIEKEGTYLGIDRIPFVPFFTNEKTGNYRVKPPLLDLADLQMEIYRELARGDQIKELTGFPMLVGEGIARPEPTQQIDSDGNVVSTNPTPQMDVGPGVILFAPANMDGKNPTWKYIQPDAATVKELREAAKDAIEAFRHLANQPMTRRSGNMVATASAIDAGKAHSAIEAWAHLFADAINQALVFTAQWLDLPDTVSVVMPEINIPGLNGSAETTALSSAQTRGVISKKVEASELARRGVLGPDYDYDADQEEIAKDREGLEAEAMIDPITGKPIPPKDPNDPPADPADDPIDQ